MKQGEMFRLGDDSSIKVYDEVYNVENDIKGEKLAVSQHPISQTLKYEETQSVMPSPMVKKSPSKKVDAKLMAKTDLAKKK